MQKYEIGIVGGGMVGSFAAACLARHFSLALIEPNDPLPLEEIPHLRVSALTPFSIDLLQKESIFDYLDPARLGEILGMELTDESARLSLRGSEIGQLRLGYIVENEHLNAAINQRLKALDLAQIKARAERVERVPEGWIVHVQDQDPIFVKILLIAEGGNSQLRRQLNVNMEIMDYQQTAWVCHVESEKPHGLLAYQRFLETGTLAFLPLFKPNWSSVVWTLPSTQTFDLEALEQAFPDLGKLKRISKIGQFPLFAQQAESYVGKGFALLGDAAHTVHPLAGQGVNLGFHDVAALLEVLKEKAPLQNYPKRVKIHNQLYSLGFSLLNRLYQDEHYAVKAFRQLGWKALSRVELLKKLLIKMMV
jgi:ubiquinone biosynthesis UbiH/UbiF/VisC/COQ6 family hydroxylase